MKGGVFKLNMHPREYFNGNPYIEDGKGGRRRGETKDRSKSAPTGKKPFKYSSPGKRVRLKKILSFTLLSSFSSSSVELKTVVSINFPKVAKKILMSSVRCLIK